MKLNTTIMTMVLILEGFMSLVTLVLNENYQCLKELARQVVSTYTLLLDVDGK
jgi:hypothetical protein